MNSSQLNENEKKKFFSKMFDPEQIEGARKKGNLNIKRASFLVVLIRLSR